MSDDRVVELKKAVEEMWAETRLLVNSMEDDLAKALNGVGTATTRARKGLSLVKKNADQIRKTLLELRKAKAEAKQNG